MASVKKGDHVSWKNGGATAHGVVEDVKTTKTTRKIKGKEITRNGSKENPAVTVKSDKGGVALHSGSELHKG